MVMMMVMMMVMVMVGRAWRRQRPMASCAERQPEKAWPVVEYLPNEWCGGAGDRRPPAAASTEEEEEEGRGQ